MGSRGAGGVGGGGEGGQKVDWKDSDGFCVSNRFQKYLAHWEQLTVQLRANDHLQSVSSVMSHIGVSACSFILCLCVCPLSYLYLCFYVRMLDPHTCCQLATTEGPIDGL